MSASNPRRILAVLWLAVGQARAERDEAKEAFDAASPHDGLENLYDAWVMGRDAYVAALERYTRAAHAVTACDVEEQIRMTLELRAEAVMGARS